MLIQNSFDESGRLGSFIDGAANAFLMKNSGDGAPTTSGGAALTASTYGGVSGASDDTSIVTGLLPNVWGMTLKAPTANGLDISARLGLYTHERW